MKKSLVGLSDEAQRCAAGFRFGPTQVLSQLPESIMFLGFFFGLCMGHCHIRIVEG